MARIFRRKIIHKRAVTFRVQMLVSLVFSHRTDRTDRKKEGDRKSCYRENNSKMTTGWSDEAVDGVSYTTTASHSFIH